MHRKRGHAASSSFFKCKDDFSNLCTWEVIDQVDKTLTSAPPHAILESSESERATASNTDKCLMLLLFATKGRKTFIGITCTSKCSPHLCALKTSLAHHPSGRCLRSYGRNSTATILESHSLLDPFCWGT